MAFEITLNDSAEIIQHVFDVTEHNLSKGKHQRVAAFLWGTMGLGKSSIVRQIARAMNYKLIDFRLSQKDVSDIAGIPTVTHNENDTTVEWSIPKAYPRRNFGNYTILEKSESEIDETLEGNIVINGKEIPDHPRSKYWDGAILFFDELVNADPIIQAACYQIVLDGELGEWKAPFNLFVLAAGNGEDDGGNTFPMLDPLANRFTHIHVKYDADTMLQHFERIGVHPSVVGFLYANKEKGHMYKDKPAGDPAFATPRTWENVSDTLYQNERKPMRKLLLNAKIAGDVGVGTQTYFTGYLDVVDKLPDVCAILDGKPVEFNGKEGDSVGVAFALGTSLSYELKHRWNKITDEGKREPTEKEYANFDKECDRYIDFLLNRVDGEVIIMATKMVLVNFGIDFRTGNIPSWKPYAKQYAKAALGIK